MCHKRMQKKRNETTTANVIISQRISFENQTEKKIFIRRLLAFISYTLRFFFQLQHLRQQTLMKKWCNKLFFFEAEKKKRKTFQFTNRFFSTFISLSISWANKFRQTIEKFFKIKENTCRIGHPTCFLEFCVLQWMCTH